MTAFHSDTMWFATGRSVDCSTMMNHHTLSKSHYPYQLRRKTQRNNVVHSRTAVPLMIPSRTHDFGWCDQDELHTVKPLCECSHDCTYFCESGLHDWSKDLIEDELIFAIEL